MDQNEFDYDATIGFMEIRECLPFVDPDNLSPEGVVMILLHLFNQKPGFVDRGHECNNKDTAWINAYLFRLQLITGDNGMEAFRVEKIGSSVDKMAALRGC